MNQVLLVIGVVSIVILVAYCVYLILDLRKTSVALRKTIESTNTELSPALRELKETLVHVNKIGGNAAAVSGTARQITDTVEDLERTVRRFLDRHREVLGEAAEGHLSGLKAGITSAIQALLSQRAGGEGGTAMKEELGVTGGVPKDRSGLVPFLMGGIIGAGIALLLAPKSGKELRKNIKDAASEGKEKLTAAVDRGKELYTEGRSVVSEAIEAGKAAYHEEKEKHLKAV